MDKVLSVHPVKVKVRIDCNAGEFDSFGLLVLTVLEHRIELSVHRFFGFG